MLIRARILLLLIASTSYAQEPCNTSKTSLPTLTFSLPGFYPGSLDDHCQKSLHVAKNLGFTGVAISPAYFIVVNGLYFSKSPRAGEVYRCLNEAWNQGFEILYKPHLEIDSQRTQKVDEEGEKLWKTPGTTAEDILKHAATSHETGEWRAMLSYLPGTDFEENVLSEFNQWVVDHSNEIKKSYRKVDVSLVTELQGSIMSFPQYWTELILRERKTLAKVSNKIKIGIDATVFKPDHPDRIPFLNALKSQCLEFEKLLNASDFFAISAYGNLQELDAPRASRLLDKIAAEQILEPHLLEPNQTKTSVCHFKDQTQKHVLKNLNYGEFGYGGDLTRTWSSASLRYINPETQAAARKDAVFAITDFIESLEYRSSVQNHPSRWANVWNTGAFDLFGFSSIPVLGDLRQPPGKIDVSKVPEVKEITRLLKTYSQRRCDSTRSNSQGR